MYAVSVWFLVAACAGEAEDSPADSDSGGAGVPGYTVEWETEPAPLLAASAGVFTEHLLLDGEPIPDLQANHQRYVHTLFVSRDLSSFTHTHMEDFVALTATDIRTSTFTFPLTLPLSGEYLVAFDYAHRDEWLHSTDWLTVGGDTPQLDTPEHDYATTVEAGDVRVTLTWDVPAVPGYESVFTAHITTLDGTDVTDLTPWLGADGHVVLVNDSLSWVSHTHAWFPDMESMTPTMTMPHVYDGPELPFHYIFPASGTYKLWVQFVRASAPDTVYAVPFSFRVEG